MPTFNLATPDRGATKETRTRVLANSFGDGYEQSIGDGINNVYEDWNLTFSVRTRSLVTSISDFFKAQGGFASFDWVTPDGIQKKFKCKSWSATYDTDTNCSLTCKFEEVFEP